MIRSEADRLTRVAVCPPGEHYRASELKKHNFTQTPDLDLALEQHRLLVQTMEAFGAEVLIHRELEGHPNSVFVQDPVLCTQAGVVRLRMGLDTRRGEEDWLAAFLEGQGVARSGEIVGPGCVEGGDVILMGYLAFVGLSGRTNQEGANQMAALLKDIGYEVRVAPVHEPFLHLGGSMTPLAPGLVLCCAGAHPEGFFRGLRTIEVKDQGFISGNVINLGQGEVIVQNTNLPAIRLLEDAGFRVHALDLSEFVKGTGGPSCLFQPVERVTA